MEEVRGSKLTGIFYDDIETETLERYAEKMLELYIPPPSNVWAPIWFGSLTSNGEVPVVPRRVRLWRKLRGFIDDHWPTFHWGPCDDKDCWC